MYYNFNKNGEIISAAPHKKNLYRSIRDCIFGEADDIPQILADAENREDALYAKIAWLENEISIKNDTIMSMYKEVNNNKWLIK